MSGPYVTTEWVEQLTLPGRELYDLGDGVLSALPSNEGNSLYDHGARVYDRLIGGRVYNRLVWQTSPRSYTAFADAAVAAGDGPLLDVGAGTAVFTAPSYRASARRVVLVDSSLGMLRRAAERLRDTDWERVCLVHADLLDLPFVPGSFGTVTAHGLLHLFDNAERLLRILRAQAGPNGSVYVSSLVAETRRGHLMLRLLHRIGEAAVPRSEQHVDRLARSALGDVEASREGAMEFLHTREGPGASST